MTSKRFDLVKRLYAHSVLGEKVNQKIRLDKLKTIIAKEVVADRKQLRLSPDEETTIVTTTLQEELEELKSQGKGWEDPQVKELVEKLKELGAAPPQLQTREDAAALEKLKQQQLQSKERAWSEFYPKKTPVQKQEQEVKKQEKKEKEEVIPELLDLPDSTFGTEEDVASIISGIPATKKVPDVETIKKKVDKSNKPAKFKTQEEIARDNAVKSILEKYRIEELSYTEAKAALKELDPTIPDRDVLAKLSIIRTVSFEDVELEKYLLNPMTPRSDLMKKLKEKYNNTLSPQAKNLKNLLSVITVDKGKLENPMVFDIETLSPSTVAAQLSSKKVESEVLLEKITEQDIAQLNEYLSLQSTEKNKEKVLKQKKEFYMSLSGEAKGFFKLLKSMGLLDDSMGDVLTVSKADVEKAKKFFDSSYVTFSEELIGYYNKIKELKDSVPEKKDEVPRDFPNETMIFSKPEKAFAPGTVVEEKIIEKDGQQISSKIYSPTTRQLIPCSNGHYSKPFEIDKKTNKVVERTKCEYCKENISSKDLKEKLTNLKKEVDLEIQEERAKNKNDLNNGLISQSEFAKRENDLDTVEATKQFKSQIEKIKEKKLTPIKMEIAKLESDYVSGKVKKDDYDKKINELIALEDEVSESTNFSSLEAKISNLTPKPFYLFQYGVKIKGPWGLADKSRTRGEDILESGSKAPEEGEAYKVKSYLERMNVEADEYGYVKLEKQPDGTLLANPLPKGKEVFFTHRDILNKLALGENPRKFKSMLAEQEIKNEFLNNQINFDEAVRDITDILNGEGEIFTEEDMSKNVIIAKEKLILEQLRYRKINHEQANSQLEDLGINKEEAIKKTNKIVQFKNLPEAKSYVCSRPSYNVIRKNDGSTQGKSIVWGDDVPNAIWNIDSIRPAIAERLQYVNDVLKPRARVYNAATKAIEFAKTIAAILAATTEKEKSLGLDNPEKRAFVKQLITVLRKNPTELSRFNQYQAKNDVRKGLDKELYSFQTSLKTKKESGEELSKEEMLLAKSGKKDDLTGKSYLHIALDWIDYQRINNKPYIEATKKFNKAQESFVRAFEGLDKKPKEKEEVVKELPEDLMSFVGSSEKQQETVANIVTDLATTQNELSQNQDIVNMATTMETEKDEVKDILDLIGKKASIRKEKVLSIALSCLE